MGRFSLILSSLFLFFGLIGPASGARVTGEEGVTPTQPTKEQWIRKQRNPPLRRTQENRTPQQRAPLPTMKQKSISRDAANNGITSKDAANEERFVTIDFDNVDMAIFIKFFSELTGKNFVIDKGVGGKVTVISPNKISIDEAYKVFESVLEVYGYATVSAGDIIKIIPAAAAKSKNIETRLKKEAISAEDRIVTQLIPLKYADPDELKKLFTPFISKSSLIVPYKPTGTLIVTDVLSNIERLTKIIDEIDVEGVGEEITVMQLENATASVLSKSLSAIFQKRVIRGKNVPSVAEGPIKITSDERTNSLIILASENDTQKIKRLIKMLDRETPRGEGGIHVYYLQNANAEDLASVLKAIPKDQKQGTIKGKAPVVSTDVQIVADKATNSLVITANKSDFQILENVIKKLDITRRMVYIEALFMEVDVEKDFELGVNWQAGKDIGNFEGQEVVAAAASNVGKSVSVDATGNLALSGLSMGVLGEGIQIGEMTFGSISALINAYKFDRDVKILSTPQIMTLDNEEAEIIVAKNTPFLTSTGTTTSEIDYQNYEYKDVGVTLNITPQINRDRFVRLKIMQEISEIFGDVDPANPRPTTLKRQTKTTVTVKDGQTVVIGGLIDETLETSTSSVPCLGSIPLLGWLFKATGDSTDKTNLYIFITPHIIENVEEAQEVFEEKRDDIKNVESGNIKLYQTPWSDDIEKDEIIIEEEE